MANHKSAIKRARQNITRKARNAGYKTRAKNAIQEVRVAVANEGTEDAKLSLVKTISILQKNQTKGIMHRNTAGRKISRLTRQVNALSAMSAQENKEQTPDSPK